jgi:hypothetical protein
MGLGSVLGGIVGGPVGAALGSAYDASRDRQHGLNAVNHANQLNIHNAKHQYQWMMQDMRKAGLNPILASKMGPLNIPSAQVNPNTAQSANAANINKTMSQSDMIRVQTGIQDNIKYMSDQFVDAWKNSGANIVELVSNANWENIGEWIGNKIGEAKDSVVNFLRNNFNNPLDFFRMLGKDVANIVDTIIKKGKGESKEDPWLIEHFKR